MARLAGKLVGVLIVAGLLFAGGLWVSSKGWLGGIFGAGEVTTSSEEIVKSVTTEQQVVLLTLGIEGLETADQEGLLFGKNFALADRKTMIEYGLKFAETGPVASDA